MAMERQDFQELANSSKGQVTHFRVNHTPGCWPFKGKPGSPEPTAPTCLLHLVPTLGAAVPCPNHPGGRYAAGKGGSPGAPEAAEMIESSQT